MLQLTVRRIRYNGVFYVSSLFFSPNEYIFNMVSVFMHILDCYRTDTSTQTKGLIGFLLTILYNNCLVEVPCPGIERVSVENCGELTWREIYFSVSWLESQKVNGFKKN